MESITVVLILMLGLAFGFVGALFIVRQRRKPARKSKPAKDRGAWLTFHQLKVLQKIAQRGRDGMQLWQAEISLATIRSLWKRGFVDTRSGGRVVATYLGRKRLRQPWPAQQPIGDQKDRALADGSGGSSISPVASGDASQQSTLTAEGH